MDTIASILFDSNNGVNVLDLDWDHLIILDTCRCDIFSYLYKKFFPSSVKYSCIISPASSTMEFVKKNFVKTNTRKLRNTVFVNANPVIDHVLGIKTLKRIFYKYIPVWRDHWDSSVGSVKPEDMYYVALKAYIRNPNRSMIIWFLQPHYPYIDSRYEHINFLGREFMNKALRKERESNLLTILRIIANILRKGYLCAGIPDKVCEYMRKNQHEVAQAYISNLIKVLIYVKKLTEVLPGKIVITADHGEAFGEPLAKLLPLPVYGHPSRTRIDSLIHVPYLEVRNNLSRNEAVKRTLRALLTFVKANNFQVR